MLVAESLANRFLDITFLLVQSLTTFPHLSPAAATSFSPPGWKATEKILSGTTWDLGWGFGPRNPPFANYLGHSLRVDGEA